VTYTRTKEKLFSTIKAAPNPADAVAAAWSQIANQASSARYTHTVWESVAISVKMVNESLFHAEAKATFARVISIDCEDDE
jgi:hypothetical protein